MGVDAEIRPKNGDSLGGANLIRVAFEENFPGIRFVRFENSNANDLQLKSFAKRLLPSWMKVKLIGPTAPFAYHGDVSAEGWAMQASFDDAEVVPVIFLSLYGNGKIADPSLREMCRDHSWNIKVF